MRPTKHEKKKSKTDFNRCKAIISRRPFLSLLRASGSKSLFPQHKINLKKSRWMIRFRASADCVEPAGIKLFFNFVSLENKRKSLKFSRQKRLASAGSTMETLLAASRTILHRPFSRCCKVIETTTRRQAELFDNKKAIHDFILLLRLELNRRLPACV